MRFLDHTDTEPSVGLLWLRDQQKSLPGNTQHSPEKDIHAMALFEPVIPARKRTQTHALDLMAFGFGDQLFILMQSLIIFIDNEKISSETSLVLFLTCTKLLCFPINENNHKRKYLTLVTKQNNEINNISLTLFRPSRSKPYTLHSEAFHES